MPSKTTSQMFLEILTPKSSRWNEFADALDAALQKWGCDGKTLRLAKAIMTTMPDIDVDGSSAFFEEHGGFCDCEILINVDPKMFGGIEDDLVIEYSDDRVTRQ
jgi:hypothetical protein